MVTSSSPLAFSDCYTTLDRALASPSGIRLRFASEGDARHFRTRLHSARKLHRQGNAEVYDDPTHPMHGCSEYDALTVKMRRGNGDGEWFLLVEKVERPLDIEEIAPAQDSR